MHFLFFFFFHCHLSLFFPLLPVFWYLPFKLLVFCSLPLLLFLFYPISLRSPSLLSLLIISITYLFVSSHIQLNNFPISFCLSPPYSPSIPLLPIFPLTLYLLIVCSCCLQSFSGLLLYPLNSILKSLIHVPFPWTTSSLLHPLFLTICVIWQYSENFSVPQVCRQTCWRITASGLWFLSMMRCTTSSRIFLMQWTFQHGAKRIQMVSLKLRSWFLDLRVPKQNIQGQISHKGKKSNLPSRHEDQSNCYSQMQGSQNLLATGDFTVCFCHSTGYKICGYKI